MTEHILIGLFFCLAMTCTGSAKADTRPGAATVAAVVPPQQAGLLCRRAVQMVGRAAGIPDHLMSAIARVESGRTGADGQVHPWPWSINAEGVDHIYDTREAAIAGVRGLQAQGMRSIDVGCMQINLMYHPTAFATLDQAFDPAANAAYAARFLLELYAQSGSWPKAVANYHSGNPDLGRPYQQKVMEVLPQEALTDAVSPGAIGLLPPATPPGLRAGGHGMISALHPPPPRAVPQAGLAMGRGLDAYRATPVQVVTQVAQAGPATIPR